MEVSERYVNASRGNKRLNKTPPMMIAAHSASVLSLLLVVPIVATGIMAFNNATVPPSVQTTFPYIFAICARWHFKL
ncbi:hypothetical protein F3Y22_tig00110733pilonHSYRG00135 [Hibiscus syriacus]|uniref:Uncharacterized protein n=1 Tax=Hibiscus syriacus TaxID=106335 RepID=A0A6A2ZTA4_HIBSY|nr:hypothetical protein F3Y22_tig00110733pilonHSYRG00135 [Hibiscus syriacus]